MLQPLSQFGDECGRNLTEQVPLCKKDLHVESTRSYFRILAPCRLPGPTPTSNGVLQVTRSSRVFGDVTAKS